MQFLQGFYFRVTVGQNIVNAFGAGSCGGDGGHIRHFCFDGSFSQVAIVMNAIFPYRRVDNQIDLAVGNHVQDIGAAFGKFVHPFGRDACFPDEGAGGFGGQNVEVVIGKDFGDFHHFGFVFPVDGNQHRTA